MTKEHRVSLTNGALEALKSALGSPGWYDSPALAFRAGQILEMPELDIAAPEGADAVKELWRKQPIELVLSEKQRDAAKSCVEHYIKKGAFSINVHAMALMRELGLAPGD